MKKESLSDKHQKRDKKFPYVGKRTPVCFCIDTSLSMNLILDETGSKETEKTVTIEGQKGQLVQGGLSIKDCLNQQLALFYQQFSEERSRNAGLEIALITFDEVARISQDFTPFLDIKNCPIVQTKGLESNLAEGLETALNLLDKRKAYYLERQFSSYRPFLIVMTDGKIDTSDAHFQKIREELVTRTQEAKLNLIICSFTAEVAPALMELQEGNELLKEKRKGYYGNSIYHLDSKDNIAKFFHYMTETFQEGEEQLWH